MAHPCLPTLHEDIPFSEKLILWALRQLQKEHKSNPDVPPHLDHGLKLIGLGHLSPILDQVVRILVSTPSTNMVIHEPEAGEISNDEHLFLGALAALQIGQDKRQCSAILSLWLPSNSIMNLLLLGHMSAIADALAQKKLHIRSRSTNSRSTNSTSSTCGGQQATTSYNSRIRH